MIGGITEATRLGCRLRIIGIGLPILYSTGEEQRLKFSIKMEENGLESLVSRVRKAE